MTVYVCVCEWVYSGDGLGGLQYPLFIFCLQCMSIMTRVPVINVSYSVCISLGPRPNPSLIYA